MAIALVALALVSPALVLRRPPRLRMCAADSDDLGFSRARLDALPSDPATTATQMSAALTEALDSGAHARPNPDPNPSPSPYPHSNPHINPNQARARSR